MDSLVIRSLKPTWFSWLAAVLLLAGCSTEAPPAFPTGTPPPAEESVLSGGDYPLPPLPPDDGISLSIDPADLLLQPDDLAPEAGYFLPDPTWQTHLSNAAVLMGWGATGEGQVYLDATSRVDGWAAAYRRGAPLPSPEEVYHKVITFESSKGAQLELNRYSGCIDISQGYTLLESSPQIGHLTQACVMETSQNSGYSYRVEFTYRNVFHSVSGWSSTPDFEPAFIDGVAKLLLNRTLTRSQGLLSP